MTPATLLTAFRMLSTYPLPRLWLPRILFLNASSFSPSSRLSPKIEARASRYTPNAVLTLKPFAFCALTPRTLTNKSVTASISLPTGVSSETSKSAPKMRLNVFSTDALTSVVTGIVIPESSTKLYKSSKEKSIAVSCV